MSSAKIRLFLTIEKLKNAMEDPQMSYPFWEKFFPLLGDADTISMELSTLSELINEAAETAEQLIVTQGGVIFSQFTQPQQQQPNNLFGPYNTNNLLNVANRRVLNPVTNTEKVKIDTKKYFKVTEKLLSYFISASTSSTPYTVKDVIKLFLYISHVSKYKPLFDYLELALFRGEKECIPIINNDQTVIILNNLRDLTTITNYRLDYEAMVQMNNNLQRAVNNELSKYPQVKVRSIIGNDVYEKQVEPYKAYAEKFEMLVGQKSAHYVVAADNTLVFNKNLNLVENIAAAVEINCDMNRMMFNSINNLFINTVEQSAAENIKFDLHDFNKRFRILDRIRENARNNYVEKVAMGDVGTRKRIKTIATTSKTLSPITSKKSRLSCVEQTT